MSDTLRQLLNDTTPFDHAALMEFTDALLNSHSIVDLHYLGTSILGRPIPILSIGQGRREILYIGTHHGMEWLTAKLLCRFVADFCASAAGGMLPCKLSPTALCDCYTLHILPMLNPDGVEYQIHGVKEENPLWERLRNMNQNSDDFSHWQANARGVDLNHNYDANFAAYKEIERENGILQGAPTRYSGEFPESEPETAALCNFIRYHNNICGILTLHTQGEEIYYEHGGHSAPKNPAIAKRLSDLTGYQPASPEGAASYGGLTDWCADEGRIPCFTLECGRGENPLPITDLPMIYSKLRQALFCFPSLV